MRHRDKSYCDQVADLAGWTGLALGVLLGFLLAMVIYEPHVPECEEDEAVLWSGNRHTQCVPIDEMQDAAIDLYMEAVMQEARR